MSKKQTTGKKESIIQNYGLFWREDRVNWNRIKDGDLWGLVEGTTKADNRVNFGQQRGVYALYADYELVYVGQTTRAFYDRLNEHRKYDLQGRWNMFSWFGTRYVTQKGLSARSETIQRQQKTDVFDVLEGLVISISEPRLNSQGAKWGKLGVIRYYQWSGEDETE